MKINEIKNGFKLLSTIEVKDVGSILHEYVHVASGAKLVYLENDDTNCVFGIGFRTIPEDSTGVCHIIEHSLLCGSDKYPLKEPFINLVKGSLNTFLNAMTASDWTVYPVASQNQKDFSNLMAVYCDAVFAPISMKDNKPFLQEGWHLELKSKDDIPSYKGVVYNEMKGAMSGVNRILNQATNEAMYPDTCYHYNSGGEPSVIPELTYEAYKDFYKRHYAPQNSLTYIYGKLDIDEKLKFLDEEYLSKYKKNDKEIQISLQKPLINKDYAVEYPLGKVESLKDNTYFSLCYSLGVYGDRKEFIALQVLQDALLSTNVSPLKKAILDAKLGQNVEAYIDDDCIQPSLHINLQKSNVSAKGEFEKVFIDSVKELVKNGIDKKTLLASINSLEFSMKELDLGEAPKGLGLLFGMLSDFVYRKPFVNSLTFSKYFDELRKDISSGYFEGLLDKYILNSKHYVLVTACPSKTIEEKTAKEMDQKMKDLKASLSEKEIDDLVNQTTSLYAYQNREDSKEELATLPILSMKDIPLTINYLDSKKTKIKGMKAITHKLSTNKIGYVNLYFNEKVLTYEELPYVTLLLKLLKNVPTKSFDEAELGNEIKTYLGNLSFETNVASKSSDTVSASVLVSCSALEQNIPHISSLLNEILLSSKFKASKVKQILLQITSETKEKIMAQGSAVANTCALSSYSLEEAINEKQCKGVTFYHLLTNLVNNFSPKDVITKLKEISKKLFTRYNVLVSLTGDEEVINSLKENIKLLKLPRKTNEEVLAIPTINKKADGCIIPSGVSYDACGSSLNKFSLPYEGKYIALSHIVTYDYLWKEVRVKGGAYGIHLLITRNGNISLTSFRDPNVENTYLVYDSISNYLIDFKCDKTTFTSYLVGSLGSFDVPLSNRLFALEGDEYYLLGITKKDKILTKKQLLHTKIEDIKECSALFDKVKEENSIVTIGNEQKINECNRLKNKQPL